MLRSWMFCESGRNGGVSGPYGGEDETAAISLGDDGPRVPRAAAFV